METQEQEPRPIRVLLVDDHSVVREGLRLMLDLSGEFQVVGQARTARRRCGPPRSCPRTWW